MTMLLEIEPELAKLQDHLGKYKIESSIPKEKLDFEMDYIDVGFLGTGNGIGNIGALRLKGSHIDHIQIIKKQEFVKCDYAMGSHVGMGMHKHSWRKIRFFLTLPTSIQLGPIDFGTITTIKKGIFRSEVEDFMWNGFERLTTLPPGLVKDNVAEALYQDKILRELMMKCLLKEKTIMVSRYSPKGIKALKTNSKIVIESQWKVLKEIYPDAESIDMYERIAMITKEKINELKYHLTYK